MERNLNELLDNFNQRIMSRGSNVEPSRGHEINYDISTMMMHIIRLTGGDQFQAPGSSPSTSSQVNTTLAGQLANASVTQSTAGTGGGGVTSNSGGPRVIVSDLPPGTQPRTFQALTPQPQYRILPPDPDPSQGQNVPGGQKRKGDSDKGSVTEQAPSPKEARSSDDEVAPSSPTIAPSQPEPVAPSQSEPVAPYQPEPVAPSQPEPQASGSNSASGLDGALDKRDKAFKAKETAVQQVMAMFRAYHIDPIDPTMPDRLRTLSTEGLLKLHHDLQAREKAWKLRRSQFGDRETKFAMPHPPPAELSDEESDEELMRAELRQPTAATFQLTNRQRLSRCLILGSPTQAQVNTTAQQQQQLQTTIESFIRNMIQQGIGEQVVELLKQISVSGRTSRADNLLYCLAFCCRNGDMKTKQAAYAAIQDICRIPTHLFQLISYIDSKKEGQSSGWGRGLRKALKQWYKKSADNPLHLAMHVTKYWNRHGWCHRDIFRLCHIRVEDNDAVGFIVRYCVKGLKEAEEAFLKDGYMQREQLEKVHKYLLAVEEAKKCNDAEKTAQLVQEHNLVREQLRTEMLNKPEVWAVLLPHMPLFALMRNLNKMTSIGLLEDKAMLDLVISKLSNIEAMKKARIHPLKLLLAHRIYQRGRGEKGHLTWEPKREIVDCLERAFYNSFDAVESTNKRILIALDISGSMDQTFPDYPFTVREAATVMAMVTMRREPLCDVVGFHNKLISLDMFKDRTKTLDELTFETRRLGFGATDCSKPMIWARHHEKEYDAFIIYTDNETNAHKITPNQALAKYRSSMKVPGSKLVVVGMKSTSFTLADPNDVNSMDVVGFDPDTPELIRAFLMDELND